MNAIEVKNISKSYGRMQALSDVSFSVSKGEVFGLIGPEGAGWAGNDCRDCCGKGKKGWFSHCP